MNYWTALDILRQTAGELGLNRPDSVAGSDVGTIQLVAFLNSSGNELLTYYPWEQFIRSWNFNTGDCDSEGAIELPQDWRYFTDQTQWDRTNRWPLLGPKSAQEWAWLKGGLLAAAPRMRYRVFQNKFWLHPVPSASSANFDISMEYITKNWVNTGTPVDMITNESDMVLYDPWLIIKSVKKKFYELKGFDTSSVDSDFMRVFLTLTGKDKGAPKLSLTPSPSTLLIGPWSIPDGSWSVGP